MLSFVEFLEEAYGNWNAPKVVTSTQLFHKDIGIPGPLKSGPPVGMKLSYGFHSKLRAQEKGIENFPSNLPAYQLIEVESQFGKASKWVVRVPYDARRDLVLVILPNGFVKTVWPNWRNDDHKTLKRFLYNTPKEYRVSA